MKEELLNELGFEKNEVSEEESGNYPFYYYTMEFGDLTLISNADDEATKSSWLVEIFDYQSLQFTNEEDLKNLVDIFKRSVK
jgi:hypothetical protein